VLENVGLNVRRLRRARDLTQRQLAQFAGIHQQHLSAIERGLRPQLKTVDLLAHALGVRPDDLLRWVIEPVRAEQ
jgi:transcriptional regulator with XRE-family HTH domain